MNMRMPPHRRPEMIDMQLDGTPIRPPMMPALVRLAIGVAVVAGLLGAAALAFWVALTLIPIAIGAAVVAWAAWRFESWRRR